jgi:hypothetical protein
MKIDSPSEEKILPVCIGTLLPWSKLEFIFRAGNFLPCEQSNMLFRPWRGPREFSCVELVYFLDCSCMNAIWSHYE